MQISLAEESVEEFPLVVASGPISEESLIELARFIRNICDDQNVGGAIIDCQAIDGSLSAMTLHHASPAYAAEIGRTLKVAYINPPEHWNASDDRFSRNLVNNRGGLLELFDTAAEAVKSLCGS